MPRANRNSPRGSTATAATAIPSEDISTSLSLSLPPPPAPVTTTSINTNTKPVLGDFSSYRNPPLHTHALFDLPTPSPTPSLGNSPNTGPAAPEDRTLDHLSFPVPSEVLQKQLEEWARLSLATGTAPNVAVPSVAGDGSGSSWSEGGGIWPHATTSAGQSGEVLVGSWQSAHGAFFPVGAHGGEPMFPNRGRRTSETEVFDIEALNAKEDKRRRNTSASARFRVKKKERERQMEQERIDLRDKVEALEKQVGELKRENGWLRDLILEKSRERDAQTAYTAGDETPMPRSNGG
ncbi:hypothetical protein T439DRAFT_377439 [Meredithblackwellia eburnea MCA 4105]